MKNAVGCIARELLTTHEPLGLGRQRAVQVHEVGALEELVELDLLGARARRLVGSQVRVVGEHRHRERRTQLDEAAADLTDADDAERLAEQLGAAQRLRSCTVSRRIMRSATTIFFASASMNPSACSATASRPGPELLHTITPAAVHASTSMMS